VLPIHTNTEHKLFKMLMADDPSFNSDNGPSWKLAVQTWNQHAEIDPDISYKLVKQLMTFYNDWKTGLNIKQTCWRGPLLAHGNYKSSLVYFCVLHCIMKDTVGL